MENPMPQSLTRSRASSPPPPPPPPPPPDDDAAWMAEVESRLEAIHAGNIAAKMTVDEIDKTVRALCVRAEQADQELQTLHTSVEVALQSSHLPRLGGVLRDPKFLGFLGTAGGALAGMLSGALDPAAGIAAIVAAFGVWAATLSYAQGQEQRAVVAERVGMATARAQQVAAQAQAQAVQGSMPSNRTYHV